MRNIAESHVEAAALEWFGKLGYATRHGAHMAPNEAAAERASFGEGPLAGRLRAAIQRLNSVIPEEAREEAPRKVLRIASPSLIQTNRAFHQMLRDGVEVEYRRADGSLKGDRVRLIDFDDPGANDWLVVNQFTMIEGQHNRRPDVVVFVNGLPLGLIELKNAADEEATIWTAYKQIQTYTAEVPSLLQYNAVLVVSDGLQARIGSLTANQEWFKVWRTVDGQAEAAGSILELETLIRGVFEPRRFLDLLQHFITFEHDPDSDQLSKIIAGYHQFYAVNAAVEETIRASGMGHPVSEADAASEDPGGYWSGAMHGGQPGDRRAGVVWHTQGSGKSYSMLFYAGRIVRHPAMRNPTLVVLTDRNDLDDQLFGQFQRCHELLGQTPVQAESRDRLRELLRVASGGVVFTTIQKFLPAEGERMPALSERENIIVIADEAHRSQYGFLGRMNERTGEIEYGFARHMRDALPNASFIGFTGTPIEKTDANTRKVFGDYISIYDIQRAVVDKATVPIYYESRIAKLGLNQPVLGTIDDEFDEITEGEELSSREKLKTKWAALEAIVGHPTRIALIARDLVEHFERRLEAREGKAMIVCMSRRICVELHDALITLRPEWAGAADDDLEAEKGKRGVVKVVMTGSADDGPEWQPHIRNKERRRKLAVRFKDPGDPFRIVIVRDMWLTGFDAPCLHTMYADKPMRGHGLMQAIARVNRVFRDKPGGLVVDYLGLADQLKSALADYTEGGGRGAPSIDMAQAVAVLLEKYDIARGMLHGLDWSAWTGGSGAQRLALIPAAQDHILALENGKQRFIQVATELSKAFALTAATDEAINIRDDIGFILTVKAALGKQSAGSGKTPDQLDAAVRQLVAKAIVTDGEIIDVFTAAGLKQPDISILSEEFLADVRGLKHKHVAAELLEKLLRDEIKARSRRNVVQAQLFSDKLRQTLNAYHNRAIATQEVIEELIALAKEINEASHRGEQLGLTDDEVAFYDALETNDSAVAVLGEPTLKTIARELVETVKRNVSIDWTEREHARAQLRVLVKRILRKYGYPPDKQAKATETVLEQAKALCNEWAIA
jgi:type I restriction enzyme R subunit